MTEPLNATPETVISLLGAFRRRILVQSFLNRLIRTTLFLGLVLVIISALECWVTKRLSATAILPWVAAVGFLFVFVRTFFHRLPLREVAVCVDRLTQSRDRFLTVLEFSQNPEHSSPDFRRLAVDESVQFLKGQRFQNVLPIRIPSQTIWLLVPVFAIALLHWAIQQERTREMRAASAAQSEVQDTTRRLDELAEAVKKNESDVSDEELNKISEQLKRSADALRAERNGASEAEKAALRELSALEQFVKQMQQPSSKASPEEMKELAKALEQNDLLKKAAKEMEAGKLEEAAKALEEAEKEQAKGGDGVSKEQAEQTLKEAMERLEQSRQLSEAMQQLARELQKRGGAGQQSSSGLQRLAQMLKQMASQGSGGQQSQQQMLQKLLSALQNMKFGNGKESSGEKGNAGTEGQGVIQSFGSESNPDSSLPGTANQPSGHPGTDHDFGTTETPFGKKGKESGAKGADLGVKGHLGEGESLSQLMPSNGDDSKAARRYKDLYDAMAPAAEDAVVQENIPIGSRFFIKRYFESIRPKE